ncbi:hypothetical protein MASR2M79_11310 [Aminivibrio sp.]
MKLARREAQKPHGAEPELPRPGDGLPRVLPDLLSPEGGELGAVGEPLLLEQGEVVAVEAAEDAALLKESGAPSLRRTAGAAQGGRKLLPGDVLPEELPQGISSHLNEAGSSRAGGEFVLPLLPEAGNKKAHKKPVVGRVDLHPDLFGRAGLDEGPVEVLPYPYSAPLPAEGGKGCSVGGEEHIGQDGFVPGGGDEKNRIGKVFPLLPQKGGQFTGVSVGVQFQPRNLPWMSSNQ